MTSTLSNPVKLRTTISRKVRFCSVAEFKNCFQLRRLLVTGNLHNQDKQEIKTVRIVKRESERRHRDRERTNANSSINLDHVVEEDILNTEFNRSKSLPRTYMDKHDLYASQLHDKKLKSPKSVQHLPTTSAYTPNSVNSMNYNDYYNSLTAQYPMPTTELKDKPEGINVDHYLNNSMVSSAPYTSQNPKNPFLTNLTTSQKTDSIQSLNKAIGDLSPVFQSEAARQIITEMSGTSSEENSKKNPLASKQRRAIPREKRRHYTAPSNSLGTKSTKYVQSENDMNKNVIYRYNPGVSDGGTILLTGNCLLKIFRILTGVHETIWTWKWRSDRV